MTRINLYPWRLETYERSKKQFLVLLIIVSIATFILMMFISSTYSIKISIQSNDNEYLNKEIITINKEMRQIEQLKAQREALVSRLSVIQEIEQDRYSAVFLFNEIVNLINPLVVLRSIKRNDDLVKINGYAASNEDVAKFLRALDASKRFQKAVLNQIRVDQPVTAAINNNNITSIKFSSDTGAMESSSRMTGLNHVFELQFYQNKFRHDDTGIYSDNKQHNNSDSNAKENAKENAKANPGNLDKNVTNTEKKLNQQGKDA